MRLRIKNKLAKSILEKYRSNNESFEGLTLNTPEKQLLQRRQERARQKRLALERELRKEREVETWEERINRIDSYKFANPTPIKVHRSPTLWDRLKDKLKGWLHG